MGRRLRIMIFWISCQYIRISVVSKTCDMSDIAVYKVSRNSSSHRIFNEMVHKDHHSIHDFWLTCQVKSRLLRFTITLQKSRVPLDRSRSSGKSEGRAETLNEGSASQGRPRFSALYLLRNRLFHPCDRHPRSG